MNMRSLFFSVILVMTAGILSAQQQTPEARLVYFDDEYELTIVSAQGAEVFPELNMPILPGYTIETQASSAEILIRPSGSVIKLTPYSRFVMESLQGMDRAQANEFSLLRGRIRTVVNNLAGRENYSIRTPTAVGGVRGTDFSMNVVPGQQDELVVRSGLVEFLNTATGQSLQVAAGQAADIFSAVFAPRTLSPQELTSAFQDLGFQSPDIGEVLEEYAAQREQAEETPAEETPAEETPAEETPAEETPADEAQETPAPEVQESSPSQPVEIPRDNGGNAQSSAPGPALNAGQQSGGAEREAQAQAREEALAGDDEFTQFLRRLLGFEVGGIIIDGTTWQKAVIQPNFDFGTVRFGLYLPVIYAENLFDPNDWYRPDGNSEWSFGTDASFGDDWLLRGQDFLADVFLKIRYFEINDMGDPFYMKVGNLNNMFLGHGTLVMGFANDANFPAERRVGLNTGLNFGSWGTEFLFDDLAGPEVMGMRLYWPMFLGTQMGLSSVLDLDPDKYIPATDQDDNPIQTGNPLLMAFGLDWRLADLNIGIFRGIVFTDFSVHLPYYQDALGSLSAGHLGTEYLWSDTGLHNYGATAGMYGHLLGLFNYRFEARFSQGIFRHRLFDSGYDTRKGDYLLAMNQYVLGNNSDADGIFTTGVYGSGGVNLFDMVALELGYYWPWSFENGQLSFSEFDLLQLRLDVFQGTIPYIDVYGSVVYERTRFADTLINGGGELHLFDANTVLSGELIYAMAPSLDLVLVFSTTVAKDEDGNTLYEANSTMPRMVPTLAIETRIKF